LNEAASVAFSITQIKDTFIHLILKPRL